MKENSISLFFKTGTWRVGMRNTSVISKQHARLEKHICFINEVLNSPTWVANAALYFNPLPLLLSLLLYLSLDFRAVLNIYLTEANVVHFCSTNFSIALSYKFLICVKLTVYTTLSGPPRQAKSILDSDCVPRGTSVLLNIVLYPLYSILLQPCVIRVGSHM